MNSFELRIVTPDGEFYKGRAFQISLRSIDGDVSVMAGHMPYVTAIAAGECRVYTEEGKEPRRAACIGGILSVTKEYITVAASTFEWSDDIDIVRATEAKRRAEELLSGKQDSKNNALAEARLKRAITRINVAEKKK